MNGRALITGAGQRLGAEMALYLAGRGWDVALHYATSQDGAEATAEACREKGVKAVTLQADLLDEDETQALLPAAAKALGGTLSLLVNNASIFEYDTLSSATRKGWDRHMESNLRAPFVLTQAFAAQAAPAGTDAQGEPLPTGLIVNMIDQRVQKLTPEFMTYTLAKMGLWALTRTSAQALAPAIRVNAIARQRANTVLGRGSDPEDICTTLGYLLDAKAVTGQLICVDGGQHLGWKTPDILGVE